MLQAYVLHIIIQYLKIKNYCKLLAIFDTDKIILPLMTHV